MDSVEDWGPNFWYVIHIMAFHYPKHPNKVSKKKYYDYVMNIPLFLPNSKMGNEFSKLLNKYPVTPYLDSRESFIKWTHFIHNRVNESIGKNTMNYSTFIDLYTTPKEKKEERKFDYKNLIIVVLMLILMLILYNTLIL